MYLGKSLILVLSLVLPKESLRFRFCHEQGFDTSCGLAVAATLLDRFWGIPASERELFQTAFPDGAGSGDYTVSLADMAEAISSRGLSSRAYRLDWDELRTLAGKGYAPIIIHYEKPDRHFALLVGFNGERAVTVDPARGMESMSKETFMARYSGMAMLVASVGMKHDADAVLEALRWAAGRQACLDAAAERIRVGR